MTEVESVQTAGGIVVEGVRRAFGDVVAVERMDLTAPPGQVTALVGPNGAGKTTLLLVLATLLVPDEGRVSVAGFDPVLETRDVRAATGWMPDAFGSYDTLTAAEALGFAAAAYGIRRASADRRVRELLALVHLEPYADRPVHVLSRGQKQRLGLARALVHDPQVLLLDEPAAGLDPRSRVDLRELLRSLTGMGRTVLVSSHVLAELEHTADRVVFVAGGRTVAEQGVAALSREQHRPWALRALDTTALVRALERYGTEHTAPPEPVLGRTATEVEVLLTGDAAAAELVAALVRDGVRLVSVAPSVSTLEAAYLAMDQERR